MKLIKARITNFRSAEDSEEFSIERVTCLVGKNESGKSAILLALAALNPHPSTPAILDKERDYPRRFLTAYKERHPDNEAVAVSTTWELEPTELATVEAELGDGVIRRVKTGGEVKQALVIIQRRFQMNEPEWTIDVDVPKAINNILRDAKYDEAQLVALQATKDASDLASKLAAIPSPTPEQQKLAERLTAYKSFHQRVIEILKPFFPFFMYFSNYDRMDGAIQLEQLRNLKETKEIEKEEQSGARLFMEFFEYAGVPIEDILTVGTYETFNAKLQAASNNITDQILDYWTQNPDLSVHVTVDQARPQDEPPLNSGTVGRARIHNQLHRVDTPFSERSAGFVWFFSFLVKFAQVKSLGKPVVLLLDEPGLSLHGKAQGDLLRFFDEKLAPHHQIIYSTHSPFMIAPTMLTSARIVEDKVEVRGARRVAIGTKVSGEVLTTDPDTLFPLQGALGYEITQTLFIGRHTLLVEGVSDILYLQALSHALKSHGRVQLDSRWTVCPSGGIGNIRAFVSLFGGNKLVL